MIFLSLALRLPKSRKIDIMPSSVSSSRWFNPSGGLNIYAMIVFLLALVVMPHHPRIVVVAITMLILLFPFYYFVDAF